MIIFKINTFFINFFLIILFILIKDKNIPILKVEIMSISQRKATIHDLNEILRLLSDDDLGATREAFDSVKIDKVYIDAFHQISCDKNQYLMIVEDDDIIIGTCHLTIIPSLTFMASKRMQIEAVRVSRKYRGRGVGKWMIDRAILYAKKNKASIVQLTTNKVRKSVKKFYEKMGFKDSHFGMKMNIQA